MTLPGPILQDKAADPLWYKDAVIYQLHIKSFFDANNDGIGDFAGLTAKLDYLKELGVNALWLLPFYPSPLRDDGYDISDYKDVNPSYGTLEDFRHFITEAHARGLRVITELVVNHTSDQHPWFQRARTSPAGSHYRNYYVWSDSDQKYAGTRIIFSDTETSNWTWDKEANAFYWHRFFSHQPDLNFDNPEVLKEILDVMYFWLELGVDGLRLDAVPYLCEREGTNNENLPETHAILKKIRAALDARFSNRLLLAEANQWPEDVMHYFGEGDECHMAFHFPLMPRMYMAVAQEDRHPVTDIMYQTPDIPEGCQWAIFLRNHDELTLEMVTDRERDYLWDFYASDKRARINFGIRRRLAPLMNNDRRKIELLNTLLMSMPGTPIIYYGDELGMGDNIYLGDRNGVRTPMQWSPDRNGGFSRADPAQLFLPAIMDPVYGFESINVETQRRVPYSFYNWMRNLILVARGSPVFGRGSLRFLTPSNRKVLAYIREYGNERVLCVVNFARSSQAVELDMAEYAGLVPVEMLGKSAFPAIGELPYLLTLVPYGFYWFALTEKDTAAQELKAIPDLLTLVIADGWESLSSGKARQLLEKRILPGFLARQRWYKGKSAVDVKLQLLHRYAITGEYHLVLLKAEWEGESQFYIMALGIRWEGKEEIVPNAASLCRVRQSNRVGILYEVSYDENFLSAMMAALEKRSAYVSAESTLTAYYNGPAGIAGMPVKSMGAEQTNSSARAGDALIFKLVRQPQPGISLEEEMGAFLTESPAFDRTPKLLGGMRIQMGDMPLTIALAQQAILNQGDGWQVTIAYLERLLSDAHLPQDTQAEVENPFHFYTTLARQLGLRTGQLHRALAASSMNAEFGSSPMTHEDCEEWAKAAGEMADKAVQYVRRALPNLPSSSQEHAKALLEKEAIIHQKLGALKFSDAARKSRVHGDYHLGQVLLADNDFYIIDFEGEPSRSLAQRRRRISPYKDVAGMLRSFSYAAAFVLKKNPPATDENFGKAIGLLDRWNEAATRSFLEGYREEAGEIDILPLEFFLLEKALYEIVYEAQHRPDWLDIPVDGVLRILGKEQL